MSSKDSNHPYGHSTKLEAQYGIPENAGELRSEFEMEMEQAGPVKHAAGMWEDGSTDLSDPYDFAAYDPQRRIAKADAKRAERVTRRRIPGNAFQKYFAYVVPYGGLLSTGLNLASSSIGAGIIALPSAFNTSGVIMGTIYMVVIAYLTIYSYYLLGIAGDKTGLRNYEQIVRTLLGPGADYFLAFCMWLLSFGAEVSYVISVKDVLTSFLESADSTPEYLLTVNGQRMLTTVLWLIFMLPLCLPKEINTLRYFSCLAIIFIVYFVIAMVIHSAMNGLQQSPRPEIVMFTTGNIGISGLSMFMFAFLSQLNAYESYGEMKNPTPARLTLGACVSVGIVFALYFFAGLFGYLDFGPDVTGSALRQYNPIKDKMMGVGYAGILLKLCVGFGLHMIPVRDAVYHCIRLDAETVAWWKNACACGFFAAVALVAGLFIPNINVVFGLVGGFSGGFIGFIYPALMVMYCGGWSWTSIGWFHYISTYVLLVVGVIGVVFGTAASIYSQI